MGRRVRLGQQKEEKRCRISCYCHGSYFAAIKKSYMKLAFSIKNSIQFSLHLLFMWGWPMHFLWERALKLNWYRKVLSLNSAGLGYFLHYWHLWSSLLCCHVFTNSSAFLLRPSVTLKFCLKGSLLSTSSVFILTYIRAYKNPSNLAAALVTEKPHFSRVIAFAECKLEKMEHLQTRFIKCTFIFI